MSSPVQLKRFNGTESKMDLYSSESDIRYSEKNRGCSPLEKALLFVVVLALAAAVAACVAVAVVIHRQNEMEKMGNTSPTKSGQAWKTTTETTAIPTDDTVCLTPECAVTAARLYKSLDQSVHPCDDFYQYACGSWMKNNPIPDDRSSYSTFTALREDLTITLKGLLEEKTVDGEIEAVTKAKHLYKSCVDEDQIEQRGLEPLQVVYEAYGKWPLLQNYWNESNFDLIDTMVAMRAYGSSPLIFQGVSTDLKNATIRKLELDQPYLLLPGRDYYLSKRNESIPVLKTFIVSLAEALGAANMSIVEEDVDAMLDFETEVANLTVPREERRDYNKLYNLMTIDDVSVNISSKFNWMRLVGGMMNLPGVEMPITGEEPIVIYSPVYLRKVVDLIENTPKRILANYLLTTEILSLVSTLPKKIRDLETEYKKGLYGTQTERARWKRCADSTNSNMGNAVGRLFVDSSFDEDAKATALEMIANLRSAFNDLLTGIDWMDDATRKVARDKADAIKEHIGYSEKDVKNNTYLNEKYKDLSFDPTKYFENVLSKAKLTTTEGLKKLRETVDKTEWQTSPAVVNAFYSPLRNAITFPAGILQPPFFSKHYPKSMNFGGIGMVIGHEITHGFDDSGRLFNKYGDLETWWVDSVSEKFKAKAQCIIQQYSNYTVPEAEMKLNGINTQGENIADNGGLKQAFTAYREWVRKQGKEEQKLPGLSFNHNQLFFLNFAQIWCSNMREKYAVSRILTGVHSPGRFRVVGTLQNSPEFSEAFNCPKSSYMNPAKKCRVW